MTNILANSKYTSILNYYFLCLMQYVNYQSYCVLSVFQQAKITHLIYLVSNALGIIYLFYDSECTLWLIVIIFL